MSAAPVTVQKNRKMAMSLVALVLGMLLLAYASVPLYRLFCQVTGFGGTPKSISLTSEPVQVLAESANVYFNTDHARDMPIRFAPLQKDIDVQIGQQALVFFEVENLSDQPVTGVSTFNVTPNEMGKYFVKVQCFCYENQIIPPGKTVRMPVAFYLDPTMMDDDTTRDMRHITLSYTFFKAKTE